MSAGSRHHCAARLLLSADARERGVADSGAIEASIAPAVAARQHGWLAENRDALESSNEFINRYGLPLARYRNF